VTTKYKSKTGISFILGTTIGVAMSVLLWFAFSAALTSMVLHETIKYSSLNWTTPIMQTIITFLGALIAGMLVSEKKSLISLICGGTYLLVMMCIALLFADGLSQNFWIGTLCIIAGCIIASFVNMQKSNTSHGKRRGRHRR